MRDGILLHTTIYSPKDTSISYPILLKRTPYGCYPYGDTLFADELGPAEGYAKEKFIFAYQDVRGRVMSYGDFVDMRPMVSIENPDTIDESTDAYDTIDWLVENVKNNNGNVGIWGISYPGFYAACALVNAHPALKASSPQAPISDWYFDDFHHNGTFFLPHFFNFFHIFGREIDNPTQEWPSNFDHGTPDGYDFFLNDLGPLSNVNRKFYNGEVPFWDSLTQHPNYDDFWKQRSVLQHLRGIETAVLVVGGQFDAEDLYGPNQVYQTIEKNNPKANNHFVFGPWIHGGWTRSDGSSLGSVYWGNSPSPSAYYYENIELPFFKKYLMGLEVSLEEAYVFEGGNNQWRSFEQWPPKDAKADSLFLSANGALSSTFSEGFSSFISDPSKPVPYTQSITTGMAKEYMVEDQRFAARRPDVLVFQTDALGEALTLSGPLLANLLVSTNQTDADWVVKLIDVYPDDHPGFPEMENNQPMGGFQQLVRSEAFRGRYRNSFEHPEPFSPGKQEWVRVPMQSVYHTFLSGHKIMVQIQSTWFPLMDRNPQRYVDNIFTDPNEDDFVPAVHNVYGQSYIRFLTSEK